MKVSLIDEHPHFRLLAKEEVALELRFAGHPDRISQKMNELLDKGVEVAFEPGEIHITGSPLFDDTGQDGCTLQAKVEFDGAMSLICKDSEGNDLGRLNEIPGRFSGGRKELWFEGGLGNSPLSVKLGPIAPNQGGGVSINMSPSRWDGQQLNNLAYLERISTFFQALPKSTSTTIECNRDGNSIFSMTLPLQEQPFAVPLSLYLRTLGKARMVAQKFGLSVEWTQELFTRDTRIAVEELYAIFFEQGCKKRMPNVTFSAECLREGFRFDVARRARRPGYVAINSMCTYEVFGTKLEVGRLMHEYTDMKMKVLPAGKGQRTKRSKADNINVSLIGSKSTLMRVRQETEVAPNSQPETTLLSGKTNVSFSA